MTSDDMSPTLTRSSTILAVVVVYERDLDEVEAWPVLREGLEAAPDGRSWIEHVLIYDNSTEARARPLSEMSRCSYVHDAQNGGTAAAYLRAADLAEYLHCDWLLLLDHDTRMTMRYVGQARIATTAHSSDAIAALLPWIVHEGKPVSPSRVTWSGSIRPLSLRHPVRRDWRLTGIASGLLIRTSALCVLRPLLRESWLDFVDHRMFAAMRNDHLVITVFDAELEHDLSVARPSQLSNKRLRSILAGEALFVRELSLTARLLYPVRLLVRAARFSRAQPRHAATVLAHAVRIWGIR
jgi:GT2 family glycosyltransferase